MPALNPSNLSNFTRFMPLAMVTFLVATSLPERSVILATPMPLLAAITFITMKSLAGLGKTDTEVPVSSGAVMAVTTL